MAINRNPFEISGQTQVPEAGMSKMSPIEKGFSSAFSRESFKPIELTKPETPDTLDVTQIEKTKTPITLNAPSGADVEAKIADGTVAAAEEAQKQSEKVVQDVTQKETKIDATSQAEVDKLKKEADDIQKEIEKTTDDEETRQSLVEQFKQKQQQLTSKESDLFAEEEKLGLSEKRTNLQKISSQRNQVLASLKLGIAEQESKPIARQFITGRVAEMNKQALAELDSLSLMSLAVQGDIDAAEAQASRIVDAKYSPIEQELTNVSNLITLNYQDMTRSDQKKADLLQLKIDRRKEKIDQKKADDLTKFSLITTAAGNNADAKTLQAMNKAETPLEALMLGSEYLDNPSTQVIDVGGKKKLIDTRTGIILRDLGTSTSSTAKPQKIGVDSFGNDIYGVYNSTTQSFTPISAPNVSVKSTSEIDKAIVDSLQGLKFDSVSSQKQANAAVRDKLSQGDTDGAKSLLKRYVRNSASNAQIDVIDGKENLLTTLTSIKKKLQDYEDEGGDLNIFTGLSQRVLEKGGFEKDPALTGVANEIAAAIMDYRKAISGAAFTESEAKAYDALFPTTGKTIELSLSKMDSLREVADRQIDNFYKQRLGDKNWDALFGSTKGKLETPEQAIKTYLKNNPTGKGAVDKMIDAGYTDEEMAEILGISFSSDLSKSLKGSKKNVPVSQGPTTLSIGKGTVTGIDGSAYWKNGLDFVLEGGKGASVPSPFSGKVIAARDNGGWGNQVKIKLYDGNEMWVSHLDGIGVNEGDIIRQGQFIGTQGNTGNVIAYGGGDGTHLDLTIKKPDGSYFTAREVARALT